MDQQAEVERIPWRQHAAWLQHSWTPGLHASIVTKTGGGKSFLIRYGLSPMWILGGSRVLIIDNKNDPGDTLGGWGKEVHQYPAEEGPDGASETDDWRVYRLVVPKYHFDPGKRSSEGVKRARAVVGRALDLAYDHGQWVVIIDETRPLVDYESDYGLGLRGVLGNIWERGRTRPITLIAATQEPVYMPGRFYSQPSLIYIGAEVEPTNEHLRDIGGNRELVVRTIAQLEPHEFLVIIRAPLPRAMWRVMVGS